MLRMTATFGRKVSIVSNWKLETSSTTEVSGVARPTSEIAGVPMFPPTNVGIPPLASTSPASVVVVVFPFEPVIATIGPGICRVANSISPITGSPDARACSRGGASKGTPGLTTIKSCPRNVRSPCPPVSTVIPWSRSRGISSRNWSGDLVSETVTRAPCSFRNNAEATPDFPSPTTSTRLSLSSTWKSIFTTQTQGHREALKVFSVPPCLRGEIDLLPQLQRRQGKQGKYQRRDPEAHDHLRLRPAQQLEVVMNRGHLEDAFLAHLVRRHLQYYRESFNHEHAADERQQQFLLDHDGDGPDRSTQSQRPHIAHEDFCWMRVIPKKADRRPNHRAAEDGEFPNLRHMRQS